MHQDIYGSGLDHSDSDGILLRTQLTPIYDDNKIDVVLQGHDHTYARTYQLSSDGRQHADFAEYRQHGQSGQHHNLLGAALKTATKGGICKTESLLYHCGYETGNPGQSKGRVLHVLEFCDGLEIL